MPDAPWWVTLSLNPPYAGLVAAGIMLRLTKYLRKGVAYAVEAGEQVQQPNLKGYRIIDPREPSFL
jgi:hypothetical protein